MMPSVLKVCSDFKGAFTLGLLAWSEPEFVCSLMPRWTVYILVYQGPSHSSFASSSQQLLTPLLSNDGAGDGGKVHNIALCTFIYLLTYLVHNDTYICLTNALQML